MEKEALIALCRRLAAAKLGVFIEDLDTKTQSLIEIFITRPEVDFLDEGPLVFAFLRYLNLLERNKDIPPPLPAVMQRHHDRYVKLAAENKLLPEDRPQLDLAVQREVTGLVNPWGVDWD